MSKYYVTGYYVQSWTVEVEADDEDEALEIGSDFLEEGKGEEGDGAWQDEFNVWEDEEE